MKTKRSLRETLDRTREHLVLVRKEISERGHVEELQEIDALVGIAKEEAERRLRGLDQEFPETGGRERE
jgi:hypothetical protein